MPNIGPLEIAIVLIIALIIFGPKRLPELGRSLGKGINEFKDGVSNIGSDKDDDDDEDEAPAAIAPPTTDPEIAEIINEDDIEVVGQPEANPAKSEVVPERQD